MGEKCSVCGKEAKGKCPVCNRYFCVDCAFFHALSSCFNLMGTKKLKLK